MKAVYFISSNPSWGHVSAMVWRLLGEEGFLQKPSGFSFAGQEVMLYSDGEHEYYFAPTDIALCLDYPRFLPEMTEHFSDFDMSAMVTWHEGAHAPDNVLTVHSLGDVDSGYFGRANPRFMRNLLLNFDENRKSLGLEDYHVATEATHWSGVHDGEGDPSLLVEFPVPMVDIEVGSAIESWENEKACRALARTLTQVFKDDGKIVHNILCVGGIHFEPSFSDAVFTSWGNEAIGVTHILANQWLVTGGYEDDLGFERAYKAVESIEGGIEAVFFHDKLKGCYKNLVRLLEMKLNVPIYKHQRLRNPQDILWTK